MRTAWVVLRKDLRVESRTLETLPAMILLALVTFVIFHFGLNRDTIAGPMYDAAKASGRDKLPDVDRLCDFKVMEEVHAGIKA